MHVRYPMIETLAEAMNVLNLAFATYCPNH